MGRSVGRLRVVPAAIVKPRVAIGIALIAVYLVLPCVVQPATSQEPDAPPNLPADLRYLSGKHLELITDLPPREDVDDLPAVFDAAVVLWAKYFELPDPQFQSFRPRAFLMKDPQRFRRAGFLPSDLPPFPTGFYRDGRIWLYEQPVAYYRRHLLLHEGVHAFCEELLGGSGSPWYSEGIAEYLALHRWLDNRLQVGINPVAPDEVPFWGRIKLLRQAATSGKPLRLPEVMQFGADAHRQLEPYAWSWAAVFFFENHPAYREPFALCRQHLADRSPAFSQQLVSRYGSNWSHVQLEWYVFIHELEFGYDLSRASLQFEPPRSENAASFSVTLRADQGWLITGIHLEKEQPVQFSARGRYQLAQQPSIWWCEPQGITLHYYRGKPLGALLAAIVPDQDPTTMSRPVLVGKGLIWRPEHSGRLCLKINDSPALLADNAGQLQIVVHKRIESGSVPSSQP